MAVKSNANINTSLHVSNTSIQEKNEYTDGLNTHTSKSSNKRVLDTNEKVIVKQKLPFGFWNNIERCRAEALKYTSRSAFSNSSYSAYSAALKHNWLDEICPHMIKLIRPPGNYNNWLLRCDVLRYIDETRTLE